MLWCGGVSKVILPQPRKKQLVLPDKVFVKLRQGSGKDRQGTAVKAKGLKA